jgi:hypothetical protein
MYENLPIFKKALEINLYIEEAVRGFSRYHKYGIGSELREKAREFIYAITSVYYANNKRESLIRLRDVSEELKVVIYLAKEFKALRDFRQFEILSKLARELARQSQGWLGSQSS